MKKSLLLATALIGATSVFAGEPTPGTDATVYAPMTSGDVEFTLKNKWLYSNYTTGFGAGVGTDNEFGWANGNCRTATLYDDAILITDNANNGFHKFDFATGKYIGFTKYTIGGEAVESGIATTNTITTDDFGHVLVTGYVANVLKAPIVVRQLDVTTGELTEVAKIDCSAETFAGETARVDYVYVIGDVTGKEAKGQIIAGVSSCGLAVIRATLEQGTTEWVGSFDGQFNWEERGIETYPANMENWGTAAVATMIKDEEFSGDLFYIDGFTTCPTLYDKAGQTVGSFADAQALAPKPGTNGVTECSLAGKNFVIYSENQYVAPEFCRSRVACFGEGNEYSELQSFYEFPEQGLGAKSDGGIRIHCLQTKVVTDKNGKQGAYIVNYKSCNGLGLYLLAEKDFEDTVESGGVDGVEIDDNNAPAVYYNLNGVQVNNPENGLYIVKRGNKVTKEVIR